MADLDPGGLLIASPGEERILVSSSSFMRVGSRGICKLIRTIDSKYGYKGT